MTVVWLMAGTPLVFLASINAHLSTNGSNATKKPRGFFGSSCWSHVSNAAKDTHASAKVWHGVTGMVLHTIGTDLDKQLCRCIGHGKPPAWHL
jgi:hypothetical protein